MINVLILSLILILFSLSILGYGLLFNNKFFKLELNTGENGLIGFFILYLISVFFNFFISINIFFSLTILLLGFIFFIIFFFKKKNIFFDRFDFLILIAGILSAITINLHDDHLLYQLPYIDLKQQFKIIFGLIHLNDTLAYQHGLYDTMSLFNLPFYQNRFVFLIPVIFVMFFLSIIKDKINLEKEGIIFYYCFFILTLFLLKFTRSKEFGTDVPVITLLFLIQVYSLEYLKNRNIENFYKMIIFSTLAIFYKLYAVLIIFNFIIFYKEILNFTKKIFQKKKIILFLIIFGFSLTFTKSFINSGCLNYPVALTCVDKNLASWSIGKDFAKYRSDHLKASIKGWLPYVRSTNFNDLIMPENYLKKFKFNFHKNVFKDPDLERLLIVIITVLIIFFINFLFNYKSIRNDNYNNKYYKIILCSGISCLLWFIILPHVRYGGYAYVSFFLFILMNYFFSFKKVNKLFFISFISILVFYFSAKNLKRIDKEIHSIVDKKIYNEFPIPVYKEIDYEKMIKKNINFNISKHKTMCGLIPFPCLPFHYRNLDMTISEVNKYKFLASNSSQRKSLLIEEIKELNDFKRGLSGYHDNLIIKD